MLNIRKTGEGYYLASLTGPYNALGSKECHLIRKEIRSVIKPHREISINIKGVQSIDNRGGNILLELMQLADASRCKIRFMNAEPSVSAKIAQLLEKRSQLKGELEID